MSKRVHEREYAQDVRRAGEEGAHEGRPIPDMPLARHVNATAFPAQYFQSISKSGEVAHVLALRVTYDMRDIVDGFVQFASEQTPLQTQDRWSGIANESSPIWESDIVPFKPRCDFLVVNAASRPPGRQRPGQPSQAARWPCGVAVAWIDASGEPRQWQKAIAVTGPRTFGLLGPREPAKACEVRLDWALAYGGQRKIPAQDEYDPAGALKRRAGERQWDADERNPAGVGLDKRVGAAVPQIELLHQPYQGKPGQDRYPPVNFSAVGKAWLPRRALAGTYDGQWLSHQWPLPPEDFDDAYWNCAPTDQQLPYLPPRTEIRCIGLHSQSPAAQPHDGLWAGALPPYLPQVNLRHLDIPGPGVNEPMQLDTLIVDWAAEQIYAVYRFRTPATKFSDTLQLTSSMAHADRPQQALPAQQLMPIPTTT